jgi:hypothetical protein
MQGQNIYFRFGGIKRDCTSTYIIVSSFFN